ncbi:hypothetical protein [Wenjunlia tyrosinilytica]|uniref:hypothetical protein n=1 Tax=Wenjunlia tyrosinilytica TaxID=1544741 RepID=UPI001E53E912|nr:hypothetical protein [Wenjunlia tyrosinilytica]
MGFTFAADGSYAACLADTRDGEWFPERWTLGGPEPYTVPLPGREPEEPGSRVLPLEDGRVLICRREGAHRREGGPRPANGKGQGRGNGNGTGRGGNGVGDGTAGDGGGRGGFSLALLSPTGPGTAELPVGRLALDEVRLLPLPTPPVRPGGSAWQAGPALALALGSSADGSGERTTSVWLISSDSPSPDRLAELPGRHLGGIWLDREGRMLALDRVADGRVKTVVLDMESGEATPLLQIAPESNDRLLLADPESGLLVVRSDAPGSDRVGWGVLCSERPVRFPECLRLPDAVVTPFAVQPGPALTPEECGVALRIEGPQRSRLAVWRPARRRLDELTAPEGWLVGAGHWSHNGLRLPYATGDCPFGVATVSAEEEGGAPPDATRPELTRPVAARSPSTPAPSERPAATRPHSPRPASANPSPGQPAITLPRAADRPPLRTPVPLQQAPLTTAQAPLTTART